MKYINKNSLIIIMALMASSFGSIQSAARPYPLWRLPVDKLIRENLEKIRLERAARRVPGRNLSVSTLAAQLDTPPSSPAPSSSLSASSCPSPSSSPMRPLISSPPASTSPSQLISPFTASLGLSSHWKVSAASASSNA